MAGPERLDAFGLMKSFRSDETALGEALALFVERPDYGFVWLAYDDGIPVACVSVAFAISTEVGALAAELRDLWVVPDRRRRGIGSALLATLHGRLDQLGVLRVDATVDDAGSRGLFAARGYRSRDTASFSLVRR